MMPPGTTVVTPVRFPPGRARLVTSPALDRIGNGNHHDRDRRRGILDGPVGLRPRRDDQVRSKRDQLPGERRQLVRLTGCVAALDDQVLALDVAALTQFLVEGHLIRRAKVGRRHVKDADPIHLRRGLRRCIERQQKNAGGKGEQDPR